jgi:hypothetical protein
VFGIGAAGERQEEEGGEMTFEFKGDQFRIAFRHDKPREWAWHAARNGSMGHNVSLVREIETGRVVLWCNGCQMKLAPLSKRERARNVECRIYHWTLDSWMSITVGRSRLNFKAGDHYEREQGRRAALHDALVSLTTKEFREVCWKAYLGRSQVKEGKKEAGKNG